MSKSIIKYDFLFTLVPYQRSTAGGRAGKGPGSDELGVVLALPLIYAGPGLSWPKPSKGLSCLGSYPTLEGQGRARAGLMASKQ